jgi:hypothetical protein
MNAKCVSYTSRNVRCSKSAKADSVYCDLHDPQRAFTTGRDVQLRLV